MEHSLVSLSNDIRMFTDSYREDFEDCMNRDIPAKEPTVRALENLIEKYGAEEYSFNLAVEIFVEQYSHDIAAVLPEILSENLPSRNSRKSLKTNIAFAAYYALSLIYKKEHNIIGLKALISEKYTPLHYLYPLAYEVKSRYYKRSGNYDEALDCDEYAITILEGMGIVNFALCISFASTVCMMYDNGFDVSKDRAQKAAQYIEHAIHHNPEYPKYHYLKGKLLYHSSRNIPEFETYEKACSQAIRCVKTALQALFSKGGTHVENERKTYTALIRQIQWEADQRREENNTDSAFKDLSASDVKALKSTILQSARPKDCLPLRPNLKPGDKYFFICYCTDDFQSVFCDLIELYSRKIPYIYDESLMHGIDWLSQVRSYISNEDCIGVLFYISKNTITSSALEKEIKLVVDDFKDHRPYFCVNLEGDCPPSQILIEAIQDQSYENLIKCGVDGERICRFLHAFTDDGVFTPKYVQDGPDGAAHFRDLIPAIKSKFPSITIENRSNINLFTMV